MPVVLTAVTNVPSAALSRATTAAQRRSPSGSTLVGDFGEPTGHGAYSGVFHARNIGARARPYTPILAVEFTKPDANGSRRRRALLGDGLQVGKTLLHLVADHLLAVEHDAHRLLDEVLAPAHAPGDDRLIGFRLELELRAAGVLERLGEVDLDIDQLGRTAVDDGHAALADLVIARPRERGILAGRRTLEAELGVGIHLRPRRPGVPLLQVVDLLEHGGRAARRWWPDAGCAVRPAAWRHSQRMRR